MAYPFVLNGQNLSVFLKGRPYTVNTAHPNFKKIINGLKEGAAEDRILGMINFKKEIAKLPKVDFRKDGMIYLDGKPMSKGLIERYKFMVQNEFPLEGFKNFIRNLAENPSESSREELHGFLEACSLPITEDGYFLAYKKVDEKFKDCHTGKIDNSVGQVVEMPREKVNPNRNQTCSSGLHVCSQSYLSSFPGSHIMICKINPRDVVSVPSDYNNAKMRVCRYEVIGEIKEDDAIVDMAVGKKGTAKVSEQKPSKGSKKPSKAEKAADLGKKEKWDDYIKTRSIPKDLTTLHGNPRQAFIKFCARLHNGNGSEKAGPEICGAKTLKELETVIFGF